MLLKNSSHVLACSISLLVSLLVCATDLFLAVRISRVMLYYMPLVLVQVGLCCNLLSLLVLARDNTMNPTTSFLLQMLALADILFLLIHPTGRWLSHHGWLSTSCRAAIDVAS